MTQDDPPRRDNCHSHAQVTATAVSLDAAGTLLRPAAPVARTYAAHAARHGFDASEATIAARFPAAFAAAPPMAFDATDVAALDTLERRWWRGVVAASLAVDGEAPAFAACFDALYSHYAAPAAWVLYSDVLPLVRALRARDVPMVVLSNFDSRLPSLLEGLGLGRYFQTVIYSTAAGAAKPASAIFEQARAALGVPMAEMTHIGDSQEADLEGGLAAGCDAWLVDRDLAATDFANRRLASLGEVR